MNLRISLPILAFGIILSANKCAGPADATATGNSGISGGKWTLRSIAGQAYKLPEGVEVPYLQVDSAMERISGFGGCNRLMGGISIHGDSISFPMMGSTKMYCEETQELERSFMQALGNSTTFSVKDDKLTLSGQGQEQAVLHLEAE
ncbi:MAG: META domain-containing protein [Flavobacteriales bacterium]|jgi:heat shock protein HslJ|nr:META domain-containing protein [Flavobacteriales bacterium]